MGLKITVQIDTTVPSGGRIRIVNQSVTGPPGTNGVGVPAGGTTGQALVKSSNTNYATTWSTISSGAPTTAQYVTLATDGTLTNERVLTAGTGITVTDAGAGSTVTVATSAILPTIIDAKGDLIVGTAADTAARLAVGTNGYVLTADSAQAGGVKWANPSPAFWTAWNSTYNFGFPGSSIYATSTFAVGNNFDVLRPFVLTRAVKIDAVACEVVSGATAGTNIRLGLTALDKYGVPTGAPIFDSGDISMATAGVKQYVPPSPITLIPGSYAVMFNKSSATPVLRFWAIHPDWGITAPATLGQVVYDNGVGKARTYGPFTTPTVVDPPGTINVNNRTSVQTFITYALLSISDAAI